MDILLGIVFILCLMFLAMIYGERLSLFGFIDGRWLTAPFDMVSSFWDMVCEAADRVWCFVFDHFWWVAATVSGSVGILLIALIMVTGLTQKAEAERLDERTLMNVGSVLDHTAVLVPKDVVQISTVVERPKLDQLVYQVPSADRYRVPPAIRGRVVTDFSNPPPEIRPVVDDLPPLETESPGYRPEPEFSRSRLSLTMEPFIERQGRRVRSPQIGELVRDSLLSLRRDDWLTFSVTQARRRMADEDATLPEDPEFALDDLYSQVRIIPGDSVTTSDLKVEKSMPPDAGAGSFEIEIRVANQSREVVRGLVVRELLPASWEPQTMQPRGVFRDSTVTWLLDELRPLEEGVLTLTVLSRESGRFESFTEVSAAAAVTTKSRVESDLPPEPRLPTRGLTPPDFPLPDLPELDFPMRPPPERPLPERRQPERRQPESPLPEPRLPELPERTLPPVEELPDVRLTLFEPPEIVTTGERVDVIFQVRNAGAAPAANVVLRVRLPVSLDHERLQDGDLNRTVDARLRSLAPDENRQVRLTVRPVEGGLHFATAELLLNGSQLDLRDFEIRAREVAETDRPILPRPDALSR